MSRMKKKVVDKTAEQTYYYSMHPEELLALCKDRRREYPEGHSQIPHIDAQIRELEQRKTTHV